jgi:retron-type reverse transcriptase
MKRFGNLWDSIVSWPNLLLAARKAQRGKRHRAVVQRFNFQQERNLLDLRDQLQDNAYRPGSFTTHWIHRPKKRMISAAPYRDRVVQHALMNVLEPILDAHFHPDSYACRKGKGTHAAARRLHELMRRYRYTLQFDIRKFFPSIDHQILKEIFRRKIKDPRVLALMDTIVDHSNEQEPMLEYFPGDELFTPLERRRGLPIGNLTSQWFANWYLTGWDYWITKKEGGCGYVRYCDDFVMLRKDRGHLNADSARGELTKLRLRIHEQRLQMQPSREGRTFVGFRVTERRWRWTNRLRRRMNAAVMSARSTR